MARPTFSVVIPTFNRAAVVQRAVGSVLNQTFADFEIIVVDDGSVDDTVNVVRQIHDDRITVIELEENCGVSKARNVGVQQSSGDYISFLDSDDEFADVFLERTLKFLADTPSEVGFSWTGKQVRRIQQASPHPDFKLVRINESIWTPRFESLEEAKRYPLKMGAPWGTGHGVTFKKGVFEDVGGLDESILARVDQDLIIRLLGKYQFVVIPEILVTIHTEAAERIEVALNNRAKAYKVMLGKYRDLIEEDPESLRYFQSTVLNSYLGDKRFAEAFAWNWQQIKRYPSGLWKYKAAVKIALLGMLNRVSSMIKRQ